MSVRLVCAICGHELIRVGVTSQLRCPLHGTRGVTEHNEAAPSLSAGAPSKPTLRDPDYDFGPST